MNDTHTIRLRTAWQREDLPEQTLYRRGFGQPSGVEPNDSLWLVCGGSMPSGEMRLNGAELLRFSGDEPAEVEVTPLIRPRNELVLIFETDSVDWDGEVCLEIRPASVDG